MLWVSSMIDNVWEQERFSGRRRRFSLMERCSPSSTWASITGDHTESLVTSLRSLDEDCR